jgi:MarR family transcriptional regulator for hemolysin
LNFIEPISRKLNNLGRICLNILSRRIKHLDINRYYYPLTLIYINNGRLSQKALAEMLDKDKSAIVSIIDVLSEKGYVNRVVNPDDRREHLISVTEKAEKDIPHIIAAFEEMNRDLTKDISAEEMQTFYNVLYKMRINIQPFLKPDHTMDNSVH